MKKIKEYHIEYYWTEQIAKRESSGGKQEG